jgi:hypothetical protein
MSDGTALAGLWALCAGGGVIVALSALTVLASAGLLVAPSLDRRPPSPTIYTNATGRRGPGTPPAPVASSSKEATR